MDKAELGRLRKLTDAATPGPWEAEHGKAVRQYSPRASVSGPSANPAIPSPDVVLVTAFSDRFIEDDAANVEFVAASRTAMPALLDHIDQLRTALGGLLYRAFEYRLDGQPYFSPTGAAQTDWASAIEYARKVLPEAVLQIPYKGSAPPADNYQDGPAG